MNILWYESAKDDMEEIYNFYFEIDPQLANKIYNSILSETEILKTHPNIAPIEDLLTGEEFIFRSLITRSRIFKIIYFVDNRNIFVYRIWCCRADPRNLK